MDDNLNVMYSVGRLPELPELALRLESALGWKPVYWITQPEIEAAVKSQFPKVFCHDFTDGNRGMGDPIDKVTLPHVPFVPPSSLDWLQMLLSLSRHVLGNAIGLEQMVTIINERLDYCLRVVSHLGIKRFIIASTPHSLLDMCFYVAVRMLGGEARMLHLTGFRGLQVILHTPNCPPLAYTGDAAAPAKSLSEIGQQELSKLSLKDVDQTPWYVVQQDKKTLEQKRLYDAADALLDDGHIAPGTVRFDCPPLLTESAKAPRQKARRWTLWKNAPFADLAVKHQRDVFARTFQPKHDEPMRRAFIHKPIGFAAPAITWREYYTYRDWALIQKRAWLRRYQALTKSFSLASATDAPYVLFALHYQPERTTMPEGGWFADQENAIRMISESLPAGWKILVKEHASQFLWQTEGELGRDPGYFDRLANIPNVSLVPLDVSATALLEHSMGVVTITGTIGWEAILRGVAVITMASAWFEAPQVTLPARDALTMTQALQKIDAGWRPDAQAVKDHLAVLESIGARCFVNPSHAPLYSDITPRMNLDALVELFVKSEVRMANGT